MESNQVTISSHADTVAYAKKVQEMRTAQDNFFKAQKLKYTGHRFETASVTPEYYLKLSKALEKEVDVLTNEIILGQKQGNLF